MLAIKQQWTSGAVDDTAMPRTLADVLAACSSVVYEYLPVEAICSLVTASRTDAQSANIAWRIVALRLGAAEARPRAFLWRSTATLYLDHYRGLRDGRFASAGSCLAAIPVAPARHLGVLGKWLSAAPYEDTATRRAIARYITGPTVGGRVGLGQDSYEKLREWMMQHVPLGGRPMSPVEALRHVLVRFPFLPIDAGVGGDRTFMAMAAVYQRHQPKETARLATRCALLDGGKHSGVDSLLHILFYSLIMLNMDLHSDKLRNVGGHTAMTRSDWRISLRRTVVGRVFDDGEMDSLYASISAGPLRAASAAETAPSGWGDWLAWGKWW